MKTLIAKTYAKMAQRGWDRIYWAIDIHDTILRGNYSTEMPTEFMPHARTVLKMLTKRPDCKLILYTCSHGPDVDNYLNYFESHGIKFDFVNENPEVENTELAAFDKKPYFNILLDDKAGFDGERHWLNILEVMGPMPLITDYAPIRP